MSELLQVRSLFKSFPSGQGHLRILRGVDLELGSNELLAITGTSGSGKSTLLHLLGGMDTPDRGSIRFLDTELVGMDLRKRARFRNRQVGFVFQFHHLLPEFTARENVMMPLLLRGVRRAETGTEADRLLEAVGLERRTDHKPGQLSGGEQQRVALARALVGKPRLLLADEPSGNLDEESSEKIHRLLFEVLDTLSLSAIIVTHDRRLADRCPRHLRLEGGVLTPCQ